MKGWKRVHQTRKRDGNESDEKRGPKRRRRGDPRNEGEGTRPGRRDKKGEKNRERVDTRNEEGGPDKADQGSTPGVKGGRKKSQARGDRKGGKEEKRRSPRAGGASTKGQREWGVPAGGPGKKGGDPTGR